MDLDGNPAPLRSTCAKRALSLKRAAADTQRRMKRVERLRKERAEERAALAEADQAAASALPAPLVIGDELLDAVPEDQGRQSASSSDADDDSDRDSDYEPAAHGDGVVSNEGRAHNLRTRALKRARMSPSDGVDGGSDDAVGAESDMPLAAQPAAALPPTKGDAGRSTPYRAKCGSWSGQGRLRLAGASRRSNARGTKPRRTEGSTSESSSASGEEVSSEDADSDDSDGPLTQRRGPSTVAGADSAGIRPPSGEAGIGDADLDVPLALRAKEFAVSVGSRVEIKWDPLRWAKERGGWCQGTVKAISAGKLRAPGKRYRIVQAGFSIVEYEGGQQFVHLLDKEHHHTFLGDEVDAWRLVSGQDSAGDVQQGAASEPEQGRGLRQAVAGKSRGGGGCKASRRPAMENGAQIAVSEGRFSTQAATAEADSDDEPIFPDGITGRAQGAVQSERSGTPAAAAQAPALPALASSGAGGLARQQHNPAGSVGLERNVWSMSFCFDAFRKILPADFRQSNARWSSQSFGYLVGRQMPKTGGFSPTANIRFSVQLDSRMYYIAYTEETGVMLFRVQQIQKHRGTDWSKTLRGYPVFTTDQALNYVNSERDCYWPGAAPSLGRATLRYIAAGDLNAGRKTYHASDVLRYLDVRCLVGVVRWQTVEEAALGGCVAGTFKLCPKQTDLIRVAAAFSAPAT